MTDMARKTMPGTPKQHGVARPKLTSSPNVRKFDKRDVSTPNVKAKGTARKMLPHYMD